MVQGSLPGDPAWGLLPSLTLRLGSLALSEKPTSKQDSPAPASEPTLTPFLRLLPPATDSFPAPWLHILDSLTSGFYSTAPLKWTQIQEAVRTSLVLELHTHCHHARSPHKLPPTQDSAGSTLTCSDVV